MPRPPPLGPTLLSLDSILFIPSIVTATRDSGQDDTPPARFLVACAVRVMPYTAMPGAWPWGLKNYRAGQAPVSPACPASTGVVRVGLPCRRQALARLAGNGKTPGRPPECIEPQHHAARDSHDRKTIRVRRVVEPHPRRHAPPRHAQSRGSRARRAPRLLHCHRCSPCDLHSAGSHTGGVRVVGIGIRLSEAATKAAGKPSRRHGAQDLQCGRAGTLGARLAARRGRAAGRADPRATESSGSVHARVASCPAQGRHRHGHRHGGLEQRPEQRRYPRFGSRRARAPAVRQRSPQLRSWSDALDAGRLG